MLGAVSEDPNPVLGEEVEVPTASAIAEEQSTTLSSITVVLAEAEAMLTDVERALSRLESGEYGTCELCGQPILEAIRSQTPLARRCGAHESSALL
jgi:RNA polymerase-binding transcription factor DksA